MAITPELGAIVRHYGPLYMKKYGDRIPSVHREALIDIASCRTEALGGHIDKCDNCGYTHFFPRSCYNRHCPKCHGIQTKEWVAKRAQELLPVTYFHLVFTVPQELQHIIRSHPKELLDILFKASSYTLMKLVAAPRYGGGKPGFISVLHTWTGKLTYHPHIHCLVPGVVISPDGSEWKLIKKRKKQYLIPVFAASKIFRARFVKLAKKALPDLSLPPAIWKKRWRVFCKPIFKNAEQVMQYLGRYIYRVAISNNRILSVRDGKVTFKYRNSNNYKWETTTLDVMEFLRRFLQHTLPKGFHKIRYYGFLAPSNRRLLHLLMLALSSTMPNAVSKLKPSQQSPTNYEPICPNCKKGKMVIVVHLFYKNNTLLVIRPPPCKEKL